MDIASLNTTTLIISVITGAFGMGYFMYGKSQQMAMPMLCGVALGIYPYFTDNIWILSGVGITLIVAPFVWRV